MRKRLALALICALAVGLSACGGSDDSSEGGTGSTPKPSEISGTVTVWDFILGSFGPGYDNAAKKLDAEFERLYPNVTVDHVAQPYENYTALYRAAFTAREGPDVMANDPGTAGVLGFKAGLEVLNDRISPELQEQITNWESATPGFTEDGDHYGVPIGAGGLTFYYNKKLFAKAGLPTDFQPATWEEVKEAGEKLKAAGIEPFAGGDKEGYENTWWFGLTASTVMTEDQARELAAGELPYTDEVVAKSFEAELMMQEAGLFPEDRYTTPFFPDGHALFGNGEGAMILGLRNITANYSEFNSMLGEENVGMFMPPGAKYFTNQAEWVWAMPTFAKNKDAAWAYIEFLASKKGIGQFVNDGVLIPNRKDVKLPPDAPVQARQLVTWGEEFDRFITPQAIVPLSVTEVFFTDINEVMQGRMSLEDAQQAMQEAAEKETAE